MNSCEAIALIDKLQVWSKLVRRLQGVTCDLAQAMTEEGEDFVAHHLKDIVTGEELAVLARIVRGAIEKQGIVLPEGD